MPKSTEAQDLQMDLQFRMPGPSIGREASEGLDLQSVGRSTPLGTGIAFLRA